MSASGFHRPDFQPSIRPAEQLKQDFTAMAEHARKFFKQTGIESNQKSILVIVRPQLRQGVLRGNQGLRDLLLRESKRNVAYREINNAADQINEPGVSHADKAQILDKILKALVGDMNASTAKFAELLFTTGTLPADEVSKTDILAIDKIKSMAGAYLKQYQENRPGRHPSIGTLAWIPGSEKSEDVFRFQAGKVGEIVLSRKDAFWIFLVMRSLHKEILDAFKRNKDADSASGQGVDESFDNEDDLDE